MAIFGYASEPGASLTAHLEEDRLLFALDEQGVGCLDVCKALEELQPPHLQLIVAGVELGLSSGRPSAPFDLLVLIFGAWVILEFILIRVK